MVGMTVVGTVFLPQLPPERLRSVAVAAEEAGLAELWLWEDCFRQSGIASAAAALAWTSRLRVGVGLLPVPFRNAAITAMELANLHRMFPGRPVIGLGHGVQDWMAQVGAKVASPLTLLDEHLDAVRALLAGSRVSVRGRYVRLDDVALDWAPSPVPPVLCGAIGDKTLRLSGQLADGTILTAGNPPSAVARARGLIDEGRAVVGRDDPHRIVVYVHAATGPDAAQRLERERVTWGYGDLTDWTVSGDAVQMAETIQRFNAAGADVVVLQPTPDDPDPEGFVRFVATEVAPLVA
jgi:alkanesulfonate monooxygenase SsuD/methylene tetrahydromethanopterin reductase-like flavin-dependent oxidoreductase (luciferase family)